MQNEKIKFSPLHDGVGFHPFSEGLPYAPQTKVSPRTENKPFPTAPAFSPQLSRGTGAVAAGTPTFAMPMTARQLQQQTPKTSPNLNQRSVVHTQAAATPELAKTLATTESPLRARFFAYLLDTVIHLAFWIAINLIATFTFHFQLDTSLLARNWIGFSLFFAFSQWFFIAMQEVLFETTIGKSFFDLEFKRSRKSFFAPSLFLRSIVFMVGMFFMGLGLLYRPQDSIAEIQFKHS